MEFYYNLIQLSTIFSLVLGLNHQLILHSLINIYQLIIVQFHLINYFGSRLYQALKYKNLKREVTIEQVGNSLVRLVFPKGECSYRGGQYFFILVPNLSYFQWHPFSVSSSPHEQDIEFFIKDLGDWTGQLYKLAGKSGTPKKINIYLDGPYGNHSIPIDSNKYQHIIALTGGIGLTPLLSILKELVLEVKDGRPLQSVDLIWIGREISLIKSVLRPQELYSLLDQAKQPLLRTYCHISGQQSDDPEMQMLKQDQNPNIIYEKGRPQLDKYFEQAHQKAVKNQGSCVGVLVCGPQSLIDSTQQLSQKWSKDGVRFDVHQEVFLF